MDGGFISVSQGRVSILSEYARMADEVIDLPQAENELAEAQPRLDSGDDDEDSRSTSAGPGPAAGGAEGSIGFCDLGITSWLPPVLSRRKARSCLPGSGS